MTHIISPRRNEPVTGPGGVPTARFSEYLERTSSAINEVVDGGATVDLSEIELKLSALRLKAWWIHD